MKTKLNYVSTFLGEYQNGKKRIQHVAPHAVTKEEAVIALRNEVAKTFNKENGIVKNAEKQRFTEFADLFLENYSKPNKKSWKCDYYTIEAHLKPVLGSYILDEITPLMIEKFRADKLKLGLKKSTTNRMLALLKTMFSVGNTWNLIATNPVKAVKLFSEKDNLKERILTLEEEETLLVECCNHLKPIVITALHTGMRKNKILTLKWNQVNLKEGVIRVEKTKSGKIREVPINRTSYTLFLRMKKSNKSEYVFLNPDTGKPFKSIRHSFENACRRVGIQNLRFHDLRHTFSCRMIQKGCDVETLKTF